MINDNDIRSKIISAIKGVFRENFAVRYNTTVMLILLKNTLEEFEEFPVENVNINYSGFRQEGTITFGIDTKDYRLYFKF